MKRIFAAVALLIIPSFVTYAQDAPRESVIDVKTTSAYSMLILRKVAVEANLQKVLSEYTSDHPSAKTPVSHRQPTIPMDLLMLYPQISQIKLKVRRRPRMPLFRRSLCNLRMSRVPPINQKQMAY